MSANMMFFIIAATMAGTGAFCFYRWRRVGRPGAYSYFPANPLAAQIYLILGVLAIGIAACCAVPVFFPMPKAP